MFKLWHKDLIAFYLIEIYGTKQLIPRLQYDKLQHKNDCIGYIDLYDWALKTQTRLWLHTIGFLKTIYSFQSQSGLTVQVLIRLSSNKALAKLDRRE